MANARYAKRLLTLEKLAAMAENAGAKLKDWGEGVGQKAREMWRRMEPKVMFALDCLSMISPLLVDVDDPAFEQSISSLKDKVAELTQKLRSLEAGSVVVTEVIRKKGGKILEIIGTIYNNVDWELIGSLSKEILINYLQENPNIASKLNSQEILEIVFFAQKGLELATAMGMTSTPAVLATIALAVISSRKGVSNKDLLPTSITDKF